MIGFDVTQQEQVAWVKERFETYTRMIEGMKWAIEHIAPRIAAYEDKLFLDMVKDE